MTNLQIQKHFFNELASFYSKNELAAIWKQFLEFELNMNPIVFIIKPEEEIGGEKVVKLEDTIRRLKKSEPIQYITGKTWFCDSIFNVNPAVLIPRPETEELVYKVCEYLSQSADNVLDIGTGSGCIAISIKKNNPKSNVVAVDISEEALNVANSNAAQILADTSVSFINRDVLKLDFVEIFKIKFDIIVSNPPYIPVIEKSTISNNVLNFEPHLALFCDTDPLQFYKAITNQAKQLLKPNGFLFFEVHENFWKEVQDMLLETDFKEVEVIQDFQGKCRMIKAINVL